MNIPKTIQKYLARQNLDRWEIEISSNRFFNNIVIVPALDEFNNIKTLIKCFEQNSPNYLSNTLILFVINNIQSECERIKNENLNSLLYLRNLIKNKNPELNLGVIDATSSDRSLPDNYGGVGLARKIGMDLALKYFNYKNNKRNIFLLLDADCNIYENYLSAVVDTFGDEKNNAAVINFKHNLPENEQEKAAIINYEIFLRYYVLGLKYAKSPFANHSVGSTIACSVESYIKVGGMNKRTAGEDFYFLEKLTKICNINYIKNTTVNASPRVSTRVPFGTGPRIKRFLNGTNNEYLLYDPRSFEILKEWLQLFYNNEHSENVSILMQRAKSIHIEIYNFLIEQQFEKNWKNILSNSKSKTQINKQKTIWMDGFRTLKLIHYLREKVYSNVDMFYAVNILFDKVGIINIHRSEEKIPSLEIQQEYLELLRNHT